MEDRFRKWAVITLIVRDGLDHHARVGHTLMQKVVYLLQAALSIDIGYSYKLYHYGPYSEELWNDLRQLSDLNVIQINADPEGYGYWISLGDQDRNKLFNDEASELPVEKIKEVMGLLRGQNTRYLELLATTHYVHSDLVNKRRQASDADVAKHVTQLKPHFSDVDVSNALSILRTHGWLN